MGCVVWTVEKARCKEDSEIEERGSNSGEEVIEEGEEENLKEAEKAIRAISLLIL